MKRLIYTFLCALMATASFGQGIEFFHGTWAEALEKAKTEKKIIFVDAFASWCGPCKRMARDVFPQQKAGEFFNANFVNMKIDMEKEENAEFAGKYPVGSFPTLLFIDENGKVVHKDIGAREVEGLIELGRKALGKNDKSGDYEKAYNEGNRDPKFLLDYVRALNSAGKPSLKITNEYLKSQTDLSSDFNLKFLLEGTVDADSRVFDLLVQHKEKAAALFGVETLKTRFEAACKNTLKKAVEYKSEALLEEAKAKMKAAHPPSAATFACEADMKYFTATKDVKHFLKAAQSFQKSEVKNNPALLDDLVAKLMRAFPDDEKVQEQAEKWAKLAAENGNKPEYYLSWAYILKRMGDKTKAKTLAEKAMQMSGDDAAMKSKIDIFIQSLGV